MTPMSGATLAELEARVAALEAERADYRAVLAAINALGANHRDHSTRVAAVESRLEAVETRLGTVESTLREHTGYLRSLDENQAEIKELLVRALSDKR